MYQPRGGRFLRYVVILAAIVALPTRGLAQSVGANASPKATDEDLFTVHAIQYLYDTWPRNFGDVTGLVENLKRVDKTISALKAAAQIRNADANVNAIIDDCRSRILAYEAYLREIGAIDSKTEIAANQDAVSTLGTAFKLGAGAADVASESGYTDRQSTGAGLAVGVVAGLFDGYLKAQRREADRKSQLEAAANALDRACNDLATRSKLRVERLASAKHWSEGEAGLDGFEAEKMSDLIARRPRDLFVRVRKAAVRHDNEVSDAVLADAEACVQSSLAVPQSGAYAEFRTLFMGTAVNTATWAAIMDLKDQCYSNGPSKHAKRAIEIAEAYLALSGADEENGSFHLARARAASGDISGAIAAANKVQKPNWTEQYDYVYAKLMSLSGDTERSLAWLRAAFANGHVGVAHAKGSPDFANLRTKLPEEFAKLVEVKFTWYIGWGYRIQDDTIELRNDSVFPLTNVALTPTITSSGYPSWTQTLRCERIDPGMRYTWKVGVSGITARGDDSKSQTTLTCDQQ